MPTVLLDIPANHLELLAQAFVLTGDAPDELIDGCSLGLSHGSSPCDGKNDCHYFRK
jgi:hypothetical protein